MESLEYLLSSGTGRRNVIVLTVVLETDGEIQYEQGKLVGDE